RQILQPQQVAFEITLMMQVNVEAKEIDILRKQIFGRWIRRVRKENLRIDGASDSNQLFDKLGDASHAEPAHHRARNFVTDQITKYGGMTGGGFKGTASRF